MATKVIMPKQGLQMTEGTIVKWLVPEGGDCVAEHPLFEMETDKLTITIYANTSGKLLKILQPEGAIVPITQMIAVIGEEGEAIDALISAEGLSFDEERSEAASKQELCEAASGVTKKDSDIRVFSSPRARKAAKEKGYNLSQITGTGPEGMIVEKDVLSYTPVKATPLARSIAAGAGVDLAALTGTGDRGKVTKEDVLASLTTKIKERKSGTQRGITVKPMNGMRKIIAERMVESLQTNASLTHQIKVDMTASTELRNSYKAVDKKISFNDIIVMAATKALMDYPVMNSQITDQGIATMGYVNIGIAVALPEGLIVPNIKDADLMRLEELAAASKELTEKAKSNELKKEDCSDGTFTISNLGMYDIDNFAAIINPPEAAILAVGAIEKTPVVVEDMIVIRPIAVLTLTYDHRIVDGMPAAQFIARIKRYLENPYLML